ncbi:GTP cyclohydrolase I [Pseudomonas cuatrocienegasensis]|uniref:GTP cyclohydrolase FolE2 n=1 Tax=Pseudomonas cuatrocienegasensis TaxID=543360 RepID=A0ABY1BPC2_9PSED|nr:MULTISPECIES: GTP cyclohydrolase FolE2 [Pseudomonas]OEC34155.1 GTP cyclohydrolase [Pseudomonas sp. 21C1]SER30307.1 GTP cyclohydrolase I [Pseudomonas cuatrocienegasensis]
MNALTLPDIAAQATHHAQALTWVGMADIALPLHLAEQRIAGRADAGVSLDDGEARGIHMSRLYLALHAFEQQPVTPALLQQVLGHFLDSHLQLSNSAYLTLRGEVLLNRPALVSPLSGWKSYPLEIRARQDTRGFHVELQVSVGYSSTCPCSAALARRLIQQRFSADFADQPLDHADVLAWLGSTQGILATPHSQRSTATLQVRLDASAAELPLLTLIDDAERALGTALQTAVKRADEQAFALANGQNLMFCEDAARRLHRCLAALPLVAGFHLRVVHAESLHAHDAVAESQQHWQPS